MAWRRRFGGRGLGLVIVILSALNMFLGVGGFLASVLGIISGAPALAWRPEPRPH
jgi:hypothetical protein